MTDLAYYRRMQEDADSVGGCDAGEQPDVLSFYHSRSAPNLEAHCARPRGETAFATTRRTTARGAGRTCRCRPSRSVVGFTARRAPPRRLPTATGGCLNWDRRQRPDHRHGTDVQHDHRHGPDARRCTARVHIAGALRVVSEPRGYLDVLVSNVGAVGGGFSITASTSHEFAAVGDGGNVSVSAGGTATVSIPTTLAPETAIA